LAWAICLCPPLNFDEPDHTRFRQLLIPFFSPHRAGWLESFVRRTARELVEEFADEGCCDAFEQFAKPLSVAVIACILGVSPANHDRFADWTTAIIERAAYEPEVAAQAGAEVCDYIMELLHEGSDGADKESYAEAPDVEQGTGSPRAVANDQRQYRR
jgi:cytochrome P450